MYKYRDVVDKAYPHCGKTKTPISNVYETAVNAVVPLK
jgi:hypothetical protein